MRTLLVTDDHESVLRTLDYVLSLCGYRSLLANSGVAALEMAAKDRFDAALVDLHMPGMGGFTLCRSLRERAIVSGRDVPVWIMTAAYLPTAATNGAEAGAVMLLKKPFDYDEFLTTLERYCSGELPIPALPTSTAPTSETSP